MRDTAWAPSSSGVATGSAAWAGAISPPWPPVRELSDDELLRRLSLLVRGSRRVEAVLVAHIAEVDARRLYAREASPSMFAYCTGVLHLSEAESYLRITAARLSREHPAVLGLLANGALTLSSIARVAPHVTAENCHDILRLAAHRSKREILELVATLAPKPDVVATFRRLPQPCVGSARGSGPIDTNGAQELRPDGVLVSHSDGMESWGERFEPGGARDPAAVALTSRGTASSLGPSDEDARRCALLAATADVGESRGETRAIAVTGELAAIPQSSGEGAREATGAREVRPGGSGRLLVPGTGASRQGTMEPLAPGRYKVQFTVSAEIRARLERLQELMHGSAQGGDLVVVIDVAVTEKLRRLEAKRLGLRLSRRKSGTGLVDGRNPVASSPAGVSSTAVSTTAASPTAVSPAAASPTAVSPAAVSPTAVSTTAVSPTAMSPTAMSPTAMSPTAMSPTAMSPTAMIPGRGGRSRHIPAAIRRAVWVRDGGRCRFAGPDGRRCPATRGLEFHHSHPFGYGGAHSVDSIRLMCRTHNLLLAEADYGIRKIRRSANEVAESSAESSARQPPPSPIRQNESR